MLVSASNTHGGRGYEEVMGEEGGGLSMGVGEEPPTLSEGGDEKGWVWGSQCTCHMWMEEEGGVSRLSEDSYPPRDAIHLKAHCHLALSY